MKLLPSPSLRNRDITRGLDLVIKEGLISEAMTTLTGGTFLMAMALILGATNFQIGLLAALPTVTNLFQLITTWLIQKYNNRRAIAVIANRLARLPLLLIGILPFIFSAQTSFGTIIFILFFHYFFGSIAGASWNSWMKDLVPSYKLGSYFARRTSMAQTLNVCLSLFIALVLDHVKINYPGYELTAYAIMFVIGGSLGLLGTRLLSKTPEPQSFLPKENLFKLYRRPLADKNFRSLLQFQALWAFSLNVATPFLTVFLLKSLGLRLSTVIVAGMCAQITGILVVRRWGAYTDRFSNKSILRVAGPLYILVLLLWPIPALYSSHSFKICIVVLLNIMSGMTSAGVNLSLNNIAIKLAPKNEAVVYLSARSMVVALASAFGPLLGGVLADYFSTTKIDFAINLNGFLGFQSLRLINLHGYSFLFIIGGLLAFTALHFLRFVTEEGEMSRGVVTTTLRSNFKSTVKQSLKPSIIFAALRGFVRKKSQYHRKVRNRVNRRFGLSR